MKTIRNVAAVLLLSGAALASSHREAPAIANDPAADNTDVYVFVTGSGASAKVNIIANWIPFEEPASGPNFFKFSDDVQYQIHITKDASQPISESVVYTFKFNTQTVPRKDVFSSTSKCPAGGGLGCVGGGREFFSQLTGDLGATPAGGGHIIQTYTVTKSVAGAPDVTFTQAAAKPFIAAPWRIGPRTQKTISGVAPNLVPVANAGNGTTTAGDGYDKSYADLFIATAAEGGTRVFAGPRADGFYVDLGGVFDLANLRARGTAQNTLAGYNVHSIALEIPISELTSEAVGTAPSLKNTIGVWATSNRKKVNILRADGSSTSYGPWVQVSRLGLPLVNEAVIGYQDKNKYNRTKPKDDVANFGAYLLNPVIVNDAEAVGIYTAVGLTAGDTYRYDRTDIIDVINLETVGCATYPTTKCHGITLANTGDVLRHDLNLPTKFPNGRGIPGATGANADRKEQVDVTDVLLSLLIGKPAALGMNEPGGTTAPLIQDHVDYAGKPFQTEFPWLALPYEGFGEGHGTPTP